MSLMVFALSYALAGVREYPNLVNRGRNKAPLVAHTQMDRTREPCAHSLDEFNIVHRTPGAL